MDPTSTRLASSTVGLQPGSSYFKLTLPADFNDSTYSIRAVDTDGSGNVYMTGRYTGVSNSVYVIKAKSDGTFVWGKRVTDSGELEPQNIFCYGTSIIVLGIRKATTPWQSYWWKFDAAGNLTTQKSYGDGSNNYVGWDFADINSSNGTVIGNSIYDSGYGYIQVDINGTLEYAKTTTPASTYFAYYGGCCMDSSGNVYQVGRSQRDGSWPPYDMNGWVTKWNSSGVKQWQNWWGFTSTTYSGWSSPAVDADDNLYVLDNNPERTSQLVKMNSSGTVTATWNSPSPVVTRYRFDSNNNMWGYDGASWAAWNSSKTGILRFSETNLHYQINIDETAEVVQMVGKSGRLWSVPSDFSLTGSSGTSWTYTTTTPANWSTATLGMPSISNPNSHSFGNRSTTTTTTSLTVAAVTPTLTPDPI